MERHERCEVVERPVFIVGSARSGSTMFWLMVDSHPEISVVGEMQFVVEYLTDDAVLSATEFAELTKHDLMFQTSGLSVDEGLDYQALVRSFLTQTLARDPAAVVAGVAHTAFSKLPTLWPEARYIHLVRDGRDVAHSMVPMGWAGHAYGASNLWLKALEEWDLLKPQLARDDYIEAVYEELVANPRCVLGNVCQFVGVGFDERMFDYVDRTDYDFPDPVHAEQWRLRPADRRAELLEHKLSARLDEYGYERAFGAPRGPTKREDSQLRLANRLGRVKQRAGIFGPRLVLTDLVTRAPGMARLPGMAKLNHRNRAAMIERRAHNRKRSWYGDRGPMG